MGTAEPPTTMRDRPLGLRPCFFISPSSISQMVGTPAARVTPSLSIISNTLSPSSSGPGNTSLAPDMAAP